MNRGVVVDSGTRVGILRAAMVGDELVAYPEIDPSRTRE